MRLLGKIPGVGRMFGGGGTPQLPPGFDPSQLAGMGGMPNRRMARAQKAMAKREQRKSQKKHKKRNKRR